MKALTRISIFLAVLVLNLPCDGQYLLSRSSYELTMTVDANDTLTPKMTFSSGTCKAYVDGVFHSSLTSGASGSIVATTGQTIKYRFSNWSSVTQIDINGDNVSFDVSSVPWPSSLQILWLHITSVSGDVSAATWPSSLTDLRIYSTSVSGDVSAATWPSSLTQLRLFNTSVSGDVSAATWPSSLVQLYLYSTSVSGDVSAATWPSSLQILWLHLTSVDYDSTVGSFATDLTTSLSQILIYDCSLSQSQVDNVLVDCDAAGLTNKTLNVGGTNAAPSATGLAAKTSLEADGWTVTITAP